MNGMDACCASYFYFFIRRCDLCVVFWLRVGKHALMIEGQLVFVCERNHSRGADMKTAKRSDSSIIFVYGMQITFFVCS